MAGGSAGPLATETGKAPSVTVVILPPATRVSDLAAAGLSVGVLSAGIDAVPAEQTFLDISQGNRIADSLYDGGLPSIRPFVDRVPGWDRIVARAGGAPADLVPGLLASTLESAGVPVRAGTGLGSAALAVPDREGEVSRGAECARRRCRGLAVISATLGEVDGLERDLRGDDLLIALAPPPPPEHGTLPMGIEGRGFDGDLTSDSTRTPGYVLATDLAPTILRRLGVAIPAEMDGEPIRAEGEGDPADVEGRAARMTAVADRRMAVLAGCLIAWVVLAAVIGLFRGEMRRPAFAWLALAVAYLPLVLMVTAALEPSAPVEALVVGLGAALAAAVTFALARGWPALSIACGATLLACAVDVAAGSHLTALSLLGPDPVFGVRFYGIGNELEAILAVLVPAGAASALSARAAAGRPPSTSAAVAVFVLCGVLTTIVFAAGRLGADVGAAIVLPIGAVAAALAVPGAAAGLSPGRRLALSLLVAPLAGVAALALIDLLSGGDAHLTRSVLDAGGAGDLAEVAERRLRLSADGFGAAAGNPLFWVVTAGIGLAIVRRRRLLAWLEAAPMARAGLIGAAAGVAAGVLANDSGASVLAAGGVALGAYLAFAWAERPSAGG
jgi:hypothetical protein